MSGNSGSPRRVQDKTDTTRKKLLYPGTSREAYMHPFSLRAFFKTYHDLKFACPHVAKDAGSDNRTVSETVCTCLVAQVTQAVQVSALSYALGKLAQGLREH